MLPLIFAPNIIEGEYAWNVHKAELESAGMLADLFGWEPAKAGGVYTYGGSGCWLYGLKYALTRVLPESREKGVRVDGKVLVSGQAHYCRQNATDWTGLGMDNVIVIPTDPETNQMDLAALESVLKDLTAKNIPVIEVVCTMGALRQGSALCRRRVRMVVADVPPLRLRRQSARILAGGPACDKEELRTDQGHTPCRRRGNRLP